MTFSQLCQGYCRLQCSRREVSELFQWAKGRLLFAFAFLHSGLQQKGQGKSRSHSYLHSDLPGSKKHTAPNERCCSARCLTPHAAQNYCHCLQWGFASLTPGSGEPCAAADASAAPLSDGRKHLAGLAPRGASARGHPSIAALELRPTACACVAVGRAPP